MKLTRLLAVTGLTMLGLIASAPSFARSKAEIDASANRAVKHFYSLNPEHQRLFEKAAGALIFGHVTKAGAGIAGQFGEGVLRVNGADVNYYKLESASVGLTLGIAHHSEIILFMTPESLNKFMKSEGWSIGGDAAVALVKTGAGGQYDTATLAKPIIGFIFHEKGLIGDLSFEGSKVTKIKTTE
jgi:lipid-binding SYLF domain-containing protein